MMLTIDEAVDRIRELSRQLGAIQEVTPEPPKPAWRQTQIVNERENDRRTVALLSGEVAYIEEGTGLS